MFQGRDFTTEYRWADGNTPIAYLQWLQRNGARLRVDLVGTR